MHATTTVRTTESYRPPSGAATSGHGEVGRLEVRTVFQVDDGPVEARQPTSWHLHVRAELDSRTSPAGGSSRPSGDVRATDGGVRRREPNDTVAAS